MKMNHYEIRFGGSGGQGMMLLGDIFAKAVGELDGREVVLTRSYGPEARGGACRSELISDSQPINYPTVRKPNFVLAMSQQACDKYCRDMDPEGILLIEPKYVHRVPKQIKHVYAISMTQLAIEETGKEVAANVVAIGAIAALAGFVDVELVRKAVQEHFKPAFRKSNDKAFDAGVRAAREQMKRFPRPA
ncbi:MAG: 2-oxoacid:acceptor oxidoreductase family protein [Megasphaera sp.]|jgi:2-oxoglutarate ferredoxin oxidoreductase subunit gamma|nr:2-oxoacid:acceptor oxidoreductase family protein [Megasphaera sp.]